MPKVSRESATRGGDYGPVVDRADEIEGYSVNFTSFREDVDGTPLLKGLPDDRCQCPHWGYVLKGKVGYTYADHEEIIEAGEAYYAPPGHTRQLYAGSEVLEFSPSDELKKTIDVMNRNMEAQKAA